MVKIDCKFNIVSTMKEEVLANEVWCAAFELAWQEMENKVLENDYTYNKENKEIGYLYTESKNPATVDKKECFIASGEMNRKLVEKLKKQVKRKLKTKSELLENLNLSKDEKMFLIYAMLVLKLKFKFKFDEMKKMPFNGSAQEIDYFGADRKSKDKLFDQVESLFYDNDTSFALSINTKSDYKIYLMAESENLTFATAYEKLDNKSINNKEFVEVRSFAVPEIEISESKRFENLVGEKLCAKGKNEFVIAQALQNIKFELNSMGAKVVSEAAIVGFEGCCPNRTRKEDFIFNKPFYLFISRSLKDKPVFALRVNKIDN